ncbi:MAG TPA: hypothetical protein VLT57_09290 [Bryobacteraceae bacterium]|nr:hypothetical protein [Bryobacteraceae bacterium]
MHIARQNAHEMVVQDGMIWMSLICAATGVIVGITMVAHGKRNGLWGALLLFLFAAIAARHTTFRFDTLQRVARWRSRVLLKVTSGTIPFDEVSDVVIDAMAAGGRGGSLTYRLCIVTAKGNTPMASSYGGGKREHYEHLRRQILDLVKPGDNQSSATAFVSPLGAPPELDSSLRALLAQGRKIDAVELLRSSANITLTEAMQRINALEESAKS